MRLHSQAFPSVTDFDPRLYDDSPDDVPTLAFTRTPSKPIPWYCSLEHCMTADCAEYGTPEECPMVASDHV